MTKSRAAKRNATIAQALEALNITAPIYKTVCRKDGTVEITTRDGTFTWKPNTAKTQRAEA